MSQSDTDTNALSENTDIASLSYEQARDQLVAIVHALESGTSTLEESLSLWEQGEALASHCQQWLDTARARLDAARQHDTQTPTPPAPTLKDSDDTR